MRYYSNSNSDRQTIVHDVLYQCGLPTVSASFNSYSLHDITRNVNSAYTDVISHIWQCAGGWQYDDSNKTTLPVAYGTLTHNQQDYSLPTDAQRVSRIEIKDSDGNFQAPLRQIDINEIKGVAMSELLSDAGLPIYYDLVGRSIMLYPKPSSAYCTLASGMAVYVDRNPTLFSTNGTTASITEPGFAEPFHKILSYSASIDFIKDKSNQDRLVMMKERLMQGLTDFYSKRNVERKANLKVAKRNYN
jgi:hypothetical protein